jgi:hypothetical protein
VAHCSITLRVHVAWWVRPYIHACATFASLFGMTPDEDKIVRTVMRGVKVRTA